MALAIGSGWRQSPAAGVSKRGRNGRRIIIRRLGKARKAGGGAQHGLVAAAKWQLWLRGACNGYWRK